MVSHLFTARTRGLPLLSSMPATSWSVAVTPERRSVTKTITSALWMASSACCRIWERITSSARGSMPPVSTSITSLFLHSQGA